MKLTSRIGETKSVSLVKELIVDVHLDYIEKDGYVWRYNEDTKKYYNTGICLMGKLGNSGPPGRKGDNGLSAYLIAKEHGFDGNVQDWLNSLKGKSAYEIAVENDFEGTEEEWLDLIGEGKSAYQIWQEQPGNENKSISEFLAWMKDTSSMIGPKFAATTADCLMVNDTPTMYYVPNGTTFNVYLADSDGQGVNAHSLATSVPGDITNYAGIYDISQDKAVNGVPDTYGSLSEALGAITDASKKKGGMTIKYIGTDGKYHQYRYAGTSIVDTDFKNEANWETTDGLQSKFLHENLFLEFTHNVRYKNTFRSTPLGLTPGKKYKVHASIPNTTTQNIGIYMSEVSSGDPTGHLVAMIPSITTGTTSSEGIYTADSTHIYFDTYINLSTANINLTVTIEELSEVDKVPLLYNDFGERTDGAITQKLFTDKFSSESFLVKEAGVALSSYSLFSLPIAFVYGYRYKIVCHITEALEGRVGFSLCQNANGGNYVFIGYIEPGDTTATFNYTPNIANAYSWLAFWTSATIGTSNNVSFEAYKIGYADLSAISSAISEEKNAFYFEMGGLDGNNNGAEYDSDYGFRTGFIPIGNNVDVTLNLYNTPSIQRVDIRKYKNGQYVGSDNIGTVNSFNVNASDDYDSIRISIIFTGTVTVLKAKQSYLIVNPPVRIDKAKGSSGTGATDVVYIEESDLAIDLSKEVLDLSSSSVTATNKKFNESGSPKVYSEQSNNYWRMIDNPIEAHAGIYYIVDDAGSPKMFQVAFIDENDNIKYLHGTNNGAEANMVSNCLIEKHNAVRLKFAVRTNTGLTGLHLIKGRKFIITDEAKRAAFEHQCSDGKINVAYIRHSQDSERITIALRMAGDFGIVKIPSGRYVLNHTIWAGLSCQSIEMNADTVLAPTDGFTNNSDNKYIMEWRYVAIDGADPEFKDVDGNSSPIGNTHITGGVFDARGLCGGLRVLNYRGMTIEGCQFMNAKTKGVSIEGSAYELRMGKCTARNDMKGLTGNIGFNLVSDDCHYHDLVAVNYNIGFRCRGNMFLTRCHPWIGTIDAATYYPDSIGFDAGNGSLNDGELADETMGVSINFTDCYSDCMRTHFKLGTLCRMIGCTCLSSDNLFHDIMNAYDTILVDSRGNDNVLVGCTFRGMGSGVHFIRSLNQTTRPIKEIGTKVSRSGGATIDESDPYV